MGFLLSNGGLGLCWPYSLMLMGMNANRSENMMENVAGFIISFLIFLLLFTMSGIWYLKKKDIQAA